MCTVCGYTHSNRFFLPRSQSHYYRLHYLFPRSRPVDLVVSNILFFLHVHVRPRRSNRMDDLLSVTANVTGVVTAVCQSCKALSDLISSFIDAPKNLTNLRDDLNALQTLIESLKQAVSPRSPDPTIRLSTEQKSCMNELIPAMNSCQTACDEFKQRLSKATSHSPPGRLSLVDRARWPFNEKDIAVLQSRLGDCKQTLSVALGVVTL